MPAGRMYKYRAGKQSGQSTRKIAKKALRIAKRNIGELFAHDQDTLVTTVTSTGVVIRLSTPAQGVGDAQRDGNVVQNVALQWMARGNASSSSTATIFRYIFVQDKQNNGVTPAIADILEGTTIDDFFPSFLADNRKRFKLLYDSGRIKMTFDADANTNSSIFMHQKKIKLSGRQDYGGTADAVASAGKNSIWVLAISNEASNTPTIVMTTRFIYRDV